MRTAPAKITLFIDKLLQLLVQCVRVIALYLIELSGVLIVFCCLEFDCFEQSLHLLLQ